MLPVAPPSGSATSAAASHPISSGSCAVTASSTSVRRAAVRIVASSSEKRSSVANISSRLVDMRLKESASSPNSSSRGTTTGVPKSCSATRRVPSRRRSTGTRKRRIWTRLSSSTNSSESSTMDGNTFWKRRLASRWSDASLASTVTHEGAAKRASRNSDL